MIAPMGETEKNGSLRGLDEIEKLYTVGDYKRALALLKRYRTDGDISVGERERLDRLERAMRSDKGVWAAFAFTLLVLIFLAAKFGI